MGRDDRSRRHQGIDAVGLAAFRQDVIAGLSAPQKALPPKHFYDAAGSRLFERICRLPEYYLTRTELALTRARIREIARFTGAGGVLMEYGSGESLKTRLLIRAIRPSVYMPVDISGDALDAAVAKLRREFPGLRIAPVPGDFSRPLGLPRFRGRDRRVVYFPGSTIGNLTPQEAKDFLRRAHTLLGDGGAMVVGVDLRKDPALLHAAYNDSAGVTAAAAPASRARTGRLARSCSLDLRASARLKSRAPWPSSCLAARNRWSASTCRSSWKSIRSRS